MTCPRCKANALIIEQAPDSFYKRVYCTACQYAEPLKYYNKKKKDAGAKKLAEDYPMGEQARKNKSSQAYDDRQNNFN